MTSRFSSDPRPYVRAITVVFVPLLTLGPASLVYVPSTVLVPGDGPATLANLAAQSTLFRAGLWGELAIALSELVMLVALFRLFQPVSEGLAVLAGAARLAMAALQGATVVPGLVALSLTDPNSLLLAFEVREAATVVWQSFFAVHCLALGMLIARSGLVPSFLGVLMALAGVGYGGLVVGGMFDLHVLNDVATLLALAEIPFFLWLAFRGVSESRWRTLTA
ncbi:MAG: DUF4386 domain-containing protein [Myxococcota bacterium]